MLYYFIGAVIGIFVGSIFVIQPFIIIFFSIPFTVKLRNMGALAINVKLIRRDIISIIIQLIIISFIYWVLSLFNHNLMVGVYSGVGFALLLGINKVFRNENNIADYIENNVKYLHPDFLNDYVAGLLNKNPYAPWLEKHIKFIAENSIKQEI